MRRYDVPLAALTAALLAFGLLMLYSASAYQALEQNGDALYTVKRQAAGVVLGLVPLVVFARTSYRRLAKWAPALYAAGVVGLLMVWLPGLGHGAKGAQRWFGVGGFHLQPAEFVKIAVLVSLAAWLHRNRGNLHDPRVLGWAAAGLALPVGLILVQPDFGSTAILVMLCGVMLFLAGLRLAWFGAGTAVVGALGAAVLVAEPYRVERLRSFLDPTAHCRDESYQVCQSLLAMHRGGLVGFGPGGSQSKLYYLPEATNDFIVAVTGEELGILGFVVILGLFGAFGWRAYTITRRAPDYFGSVLGGTLAVMVVGQAALNVGVALGVLPPKGLVLPFISYGPSAMIVNLAAVGVLLSISADAKPAPAPAVEPLAGAQPA